MSKQGSVNIDSPPPSRYPMMRGGPMGAHNSNTPMQTYGGHFGGGNRPMGPRGMSMEQSGHISGQKRDRDSAGFGVGGGGNMFPGSPGQGSINQDSGDAGNFAKLFVGSVPRTVTEDDIRPLFAEHGNVLEVALIKDKRTGQQQGCCFIKYATIEEADRAIRALHNQRTLPGGIGPIQVRYADGERERLVEYKLFVGSLSKHATEKEIEEIFAPYGRVDDVYIMRDEQKQSRGCAFVKYPSREMAMAAMNALSGKYNMKGCDQPLTVRFADPKRPKAGDMRAGPAYGGPGFGSRPQGPPGVRPSSGSVHMGGRGPPTNWRPMGTPSMGPPSHVGGRPYGSPLTPRGSASGAPTAMGGTVGGPGGPMNGSVSVAGMGTPPSQHQSFNQPFAQQQIQTYGQQPTTLQKPLQFQQLPPMQQQHQQPPQSFSQVQQSQQSLHQFGQHPQSSQPNVQQPPSLGQLSSSQQSLSLYGQLPASQPQGHPHMTQTPQQVPPSLQQQQQQHLPLPTIQQQLPQSQTQPQQHLQLQPSQQMQPQQQPQQQQQHLPLSMPQQGHATQSAFPSQQFPYLQQQQHQIHAMQSASQSQHQQQQNQSQKQQGYYQVASAQSVQQQPSWALPTQSQTPGSTAIASVPLASTALTVSTVAPAVSASNPATVTCNWTEHTSPEGYKYYYNSVSGESKWEKPEEFAAFEKQQQQPVPQQAQSQVQPQHQVQGQSVNHAQQLQHQTQQRQQQPQLQQALTTPYSGPSMIAQQAPVQNLGYGQLQGVNANLEPSRHQVQQQSGIPAMQDYNMWKSKPAGT